MRAKVVISDDPLAPMSAHDGPQPAKTTDYGEINASRAGADCTSGGKAMKSGLVERNVNEAADAITATRRLVRDGVGLAYTESGDGDPPIVFVHCWTGDHTFFAPQIGHFASKHRVVAVDLRGHGASDKPRQDYTVLGFVDDLVWLCDQIDLKKPVIIGHSMGGNVALELAVRHPDLPRAIGMIDSAIVPPPALVEAVRSLCESLYGSDYREAQRRFMGDFTFLPTDDPTEKARILDVMAAAPQHVMANALEQHILRWDGAAAAAACMVPALYIGAATPLADVARFSALCPHLVVGQTVGAGHFNNQLVPDQVNAMIDRFLATAAAG
jgi:pimeloyl-ACP methyl ester carboxylesterase